jgi:hypothetical protein
MINPALIQYGLLVSGLSGSLALFLSLKHEIRTQARRHQQRIKEMSARIAEAPPAFAPSPVRSGINASTRVQALRMLRRNETASHISAALGMQRGEVELLIRVQKMVAQASACDLPVPPQESEHLGRGSLFSVS